MEMDVKRGDLALLRHPVAEQLLRAAIPVRLAYLAGDGTPRVVPMIFHWTGTEVVVATWPDDPKVAALRAHPRVALTIDPEAPPYRVLQVRGAAEVALVAGLPPEAEAAAARFMGPEGGQAWAEQTRRLSARMARIAIRPDWVDVLDFETRFPGGLARRLRTASPVAVDSAA